MIEEMPSAPASATPTTGIAPPPVVAFPAPPAPPPPLSTASDAAPRALATESVAAPAARLAAPPAAATAAGGAAAVGTSPLAGSAPKPVGGYAAWHEKLRREAARFKPQAPAAPLTGSVQLRLTVGADGSVQAARVLRGLRADYDAEAQRLVAGSAAWIPGTDGTRPTTQAVEVAVPFR